MRQSYIGGPLSFWYQCIVHTRQSPIVLSEVCVPSNAVCLLLWVYRYDCVQDHDRQWDFKFSTVTRGQSVAVKCAGYKSSLSCHSRHIPIPGKMTCTSDFLDDLKIQQPLLTSIHLHPAEPDGWNKMPLIEIRGRRPRDVDIVGAEIFSSLHSEPISKQQRPKNVRLGGGEDVLLREWKTQI